MLTTFTASENSQIDVLLGSVSALVRNVTRRDFTVETYTEATSGADTSLLVLKQYPIVSVTSVTFKGFGGDQIVTGHTIDVAQGMLFRRSSIWNKGYQNYEVVYEAGYAILPDDLVQACAEWVSALFWKAKGNVALGPDLPTESMRRVFWQYRRSII